jgi:hypothetical protein
MGKLIVAVIIIWFCFESCNNPSQGTSQLRHDANKDSSVNRNSSNDEFSHAPKIKTLLATRFSTLEEFKSMVNIKYLNSRPSLDSSTQKEGKVKLTYRVNGNEVISELKSGITQDDFVKVRDGNFWDRLIFVFKSPYAVMSRVDLNKIYKLSRRRPTYFGEGDVAFFDLAETSVKNINTMEMAYRFAADSSEKGYLNTFNHVTAQALITTFFSEDVADFVADVHELENMPELVTGDFTVEQLSDPNNYPVDNYIDLINNELGQEIGNQLKSKYAITVSTHWTPQLLSDYLNDIQNYYSWSFEIGMKPYTPEDELIIRFCDKINIVAKGVPYSDF